MHCEAAQFQGRVYIHILKSKNWQLTPLRRVSEPLHVPHQNIFIYAQDIPKAMLKTVDLQDKIKISFDFHLLVPFPMCIPFHPSPHQLEKADLYTLVLSWFSRGTCVRKTSFLCCTLTPSLLLFYLFCYKNLFEPN